jgi:YD repeat-containing protein
VPSRVLSVQEAYTNGTSLAKWAVSYAEQAQRRRATYQAPEPSPQEVWEFLRGDIHEVAPEKIRMPVSRSIPGRKAEWRVEHNADGLVVQTVNPAGRRTQWNYDTVNPNALMRANLLSMRELPKPQGGEFSIQEFGIEQRYHSVLPLPIASDRYEVDKDGSRRILETERFEYNEYGDMICRTVGDLSSWTVYTAYGEPAIEVDGNGAMTGWSRFERFKEGEVSLAGGGLLAQAVMDAEPSSLMNEAKQRRLAIPSEFPERVLSAPPVALEVRYAYDDMGNLRHEQHRDYRVWHVPNKLGMFLAQYDTRSDLVISRYADDLRLAARGARFSVPDGSDSYRGETWPGVSGRFRVEEFHRDPRGLLARWVRSRERFGNALPEVRYERFADGTVRQRQAQGEAALITSVDSATGWVLGQRLEFNQQELPLISKMEYDAEGNLIAFEDDGGHRHSRTIDPFGRPFSEQTPDQMVREKLLDGAGRLIGERVISTDGVTRDESRSRYSNAGLPLRVERRRLAHDDRGIPIIDEWLNQEQNEYDAAGRVFRTRGVHDESTTEMVHDGLGRLIEVRKPGGDTQQSIYAGELQVATVQTYADTRDGSTRTLANMTFHTARGEPWLQVPLAQPGEPAFDRATMQRFDRLGRVVMTARPGKTIQRQNYNSLDQIERTVAAPIRETPEMGALVSEAEYDVAGRKTSTTLGNKPLALIGPDKTALNPRRAEVPQVRRFEYDQFGRLVVETQPDGLRTTRRYGRGSMVTHISRARNDKTETLRFDYDVMRRITAIRDVGNQVVQRFEYHPMGFVGRADDHTIPGRL